MTRIAVIGAGIAGLSSAWALARRGVEVSLYEQGPIPNPLSASGDEHRVIRRAYAGQAGYARRIDEAYDAWNELFADLRARHLVENGFLIISQREGDEAERYRDGLVEGDYPLEIMQPDEAVARFGFLAPGTFRYVGFSPEGGALLCRKIGIGLAAWLERAGVALYEETPVTALDPATGRLETPAGSFGPFDQIIVTAGAWVLKLVPQLADRLTPHRTAVAYFTPPEDLAHNWRAAPVILDIGGDSDGYAIPPIGGSGLKLGSGNHKRPAGPDDDREPGDDEADAIRAWFTPQIAGLETYAHEKTVTCAYTFTADEHFTMHRQDRMLVISACSGHGYKFGAALGRRVGQHVPERDDAALEAWLEARD